MDNKKQVTAEEFAYLREYGWGGAMQGAATGALAGASIGAAAASPTGIGVPFAAAIGAVGGAIVMGTAGHYAEEASDKATADREAKAVYQQKQAAFWGDESKTQSGNWTPKMYEEGGNMNPINTPPIEYEGQSHQGPDNGIPVDQQGNPSASTKKPPIALVEDGEVSYKGFIYSDKLKDENGKTFAKKAKKILSKYKPRLGKNFDRDDVMAQEAMEKEMNALANENEQKRSPKHYKELEEYRCGGGLKKKGQGGLMGKVQDKAYGMETALFPNSEYSSVNYLMGEPEEGAPLPEYGEGTQLADFMASKQYSGMTQGAELGLEAYAMYNKAKEDSNSSISESRIQNDMYNTQLRNSISNMNLEDRNYALRSYQSGGNVNKNYNIRYSNIDDKKEYSKPLKSTAWDWWANTPRGVDEGDTFGQTAMYSPQMVIFDPQEIARRKREEEITWNDPIGPYQPDPNLTWNDPVGPSQPDPTRVEFNLEDEEYIPDMPGDIKAVTEEEKVSTKREEIPYKKKYNVLGFIPGAMNVIRGALGKADVVDADNYTLNPGMIKARQYRGAEAIKDAERAAYNRLRAYNPASPTANAAQRIAVDVAQQEQLSKTREAIFNINEKLRADADNKKLAIMERNAQIRMGVDDINTQNRAAQESLITTGLGQVSQEMAGQRQEQNTMALIRSMYPEYRDVPTDLTSSDSPATGDVFDTSLDDFNKPRTAEETLNRKLRADLVRDKAMRSQDFELEEQENVPDDPYVARNYTNKYMQNVMKPFQQRAEGGPLFDFEGPTPEVASAFENDYSKYNNLPSDTTRRTQRQQEKSYKTEMKSDPRFDAYSNKQIRQISKAKVDPNTIIPAAGYTDAELVTMRNAKSPNINRMQPIESQGVVGNLPIPEITQRPVEANISIPNYEASDEYKVNPLDITPAGGFETEAEYKAWQDARVAAGMTKDFEPLTEEPMPAPKSPYDKGYDLYDPLNTEGISYGDWEKDQPWFKSEDDVTEEAARSLEPITNPEDWAYSADLGQLAEYEGRVISGKWNNELKAGDKHTVYNDQKSGVGGADVSWSKDDKTGRATIGYGHLLTADEIKNGTFKNGLTETEARALLVADSTRLNKALYKRYSWLKDMPPEVRAVMEDLNFNMGQGTDEKGLKSFKKMIPAIKRKDWETASIELVDSEYWRDNHTNSEGVVDKRALANKEVFDNLGIAKRAAAKKAADKKAANKNKKS